MLFTFGQADYTHIRDEPDAFFRGLLHQFTPPGGDWGTGAVRRVPWRGGCPSHRALLHALWPPGAPANGPARAEVQRSTLCCNACLHASSTCVCTAFDRRLEPGDDGGHPLPGPHPQGQHHCGACGPQAGSRCAVWARTCARAHCWLLHAPSRGALLAVDAGRKGHVCTRTLQASGYTRTPTGASVSGTTAHGAAPRAALKVGWRLVHGAA